jgi:hypothetical protein
VFAKAAPTIALCNAEVAASIAHLLLLHCHLLPQLHLSLPQAGKLPLQQLRFSSLLGCLLNQLCIALLQLLQLLLCFLCCFLCCVQPWLQV